MAMEDAMQSAKIMLIAFSVSSLVVLQAVAEDLTIGVGIYGKTTLFITPNDVRYRIQAPPYSSFYGSRDWIFNAATEKLTVIDHRSRTYFETTPEERNEVRRLEREDRERRLAQQKAAEIVVERRPCNPSVTKALNRGDPLRQTTLDSPDSIPQIEHCEQHLMVRNGAKPQDREDFDRRWYTNDLRAPLFLKFLDAVREEFGLFRTDDLAWIQIYDCLRNEELFPLGAAYIGSAYDRTDNPTQPTARDNSRLTYSPIDMLYPVSWGISWIRKGPIDPRIFAIQKDDRSALSATISRDYVKVGSPIARRITELKGGDSRIR
jgi:hypothetical protein